MSALIAYRNLADAATLTASAVAGFPVTNLQTRQLSTRWRLATPDSSVHTVAVDLGSIKTVRVVALLSQINFGDAGATALRLSEDGVTWTETSLMAEPDLGVPGLAPNLIRVIEAGVSARYIEIKLKRENASPAYIEAGRLWIGDALIIPYGADSDWSISTRERGTVDESAGLEVYPSAKRKGRELRMSFSVLDVAYAYGTPAGADGGTWVIPSDVPSFQDLHTHVGAIGEVIALPRTSYIWPRRVGIYGRLSEDSLSIQHIVGPNYSTSLRVIEER